MTITQVSREFGMSADTLRYYERIGLIPPVTRTPGGVRDYQQEDLHWVAFIHCMRGAGVSIEALARYVKLFAQGEDTVQERRELLLQERAALVARIEELQATLERLDAKIAHYDTGLVRGGLC